jgi:hypothetical protein
MKTLQHWRHYGSVRGWLCVRRSTNRQRISRSCRSCERILRSNFGMMIRACQGCGHQKMILTARSRRRKTRSAHALTVLTSNVSDPRPKTLELIPLYSKISPTDPSLAYTLPSETSDSLAVDADEFDFDATLVVFSETKAVELTSRFRKDADAFYVEAKRSTVSSVAQIPYWMYGMLLVLGWNEAMAVLFNPLYFTLLIIAAASAWVPFSFIRSHLLLLS